MTKVTVIPIYNLQGDIVNKIEINDELTYVSGRVCKGKNYYYKGVGVPYSRQHVSTLDGINEDEYEILGETGIFYLGYAISKKVWQNKYGIFQDRYQSIFPDFIGGCGSKEGLIVLNSEIFPKSAVEVIDAIMYDEENQHSYYILNYKGNRKSYVDDGGDPKKLKELIDFMLQNNWNFLWDKAAINDVNPDGLVTDVADLFMSDQLEHQLGTVYSVLYSLANINQKKYIEFLKENKLSHVDQSSFIFNSIKILKDNGIKTSAFFPTKDIIKNYKHVVLKHLLTGKNCAYCSCDMFTKEGNMVRDHYIQTVSAQMRNM
jgi:hypothetical protein